LNISVLIRNLNEAAKLTQTLLALRLQETDDDYEVVVVDNESDDDSVTIATSMGCKVVTLKRADFSYGRALNYGISHCSGNIIFILSAHVILLNEYFLQKMTAYFDNEQVVALRFTNAASTTVGEAVATGAQHLVFDGRSNFAEKNWNKLMINHCAAIRRSAWEQQPFDEAMLNGEDKLWVMQLLQKGFIQLYNVPCFYVYTKYLERTQKINDLIKGYHGKAVVTGHAEPAFSKSYMRSMFTQLKTELRKAKTQLHIHSKVYKGLQELTKQRNNGK